MKDKDEKNQNESKSPNLRKKNDSAKTVIRVLQGLGLGLIIYLTIPFIAFSVLAESAKNLAYMNIICPDEDLITFDPNSREIFVFQRQNRRDKIEFDVQSENRVILKIYSAKNPEKIQEMNFNIENKSTYSGKKTINKFTIKPVQLELKCIPSNDYDEAAILIFLTFISGATGSIISILSRISDYHSDEYGEVSVPFYIGVFKPIIGGAFGVFIFSVLGSGLIQFSNPLNASDNLSNSINIDKWLFFMGISFIGGFSERLAKDIIRVTEDSFKTKFENDDTEQ